ncbi:MAG TPA: hypothetical protein ENK86_06895 [Campylobacterales bacterium]|nr:hypothetical protein [Campylobacterales bacterium]
MALLFTPIFSSETNANVNTQVPAVAMDTPFILEGKALIDPRAVKKIDEIGNELYQKTGVNVYIYAKDMYQYADFESTPKKLEFIKNLEADIVSKLHDPYVLLSLSIEDIHINLLNSKELDGTLDRDDILDNYIVPLLASKDKNGVYAKVSAAVLNGYAEIADSISESKGIELASSIGNEGHTFNAVWRVFMYFVVLTGLLVYIYAVLRARKK